MRKKLLILAVIILGCASVYAGDLTGNPTDSEQPAILYEGNGFIFYGSNQLQYQLPTNDNLALDVPANDNYEDAEAIGEVNLLSFDLTEATFDGPGEFIQSRNIWYRYTASETGPIEISTWWSDVNGKIAVYNGSADFSETGPVTPVALAGGEIIESATAISGPLPVAVSGSLSGFAHNYDISDDCAGDASGSTADVVYSYTADADTSINVFLFDNSGDFTSGLILKILDAEGNELACDADWDDWLTVKILDFPVTAGQTYYFVVTDAYSSTKDYVLQISSPAYELIACSDNYYILYGALARIDAVAGEEYLIEVSGSVYGESWSGVLSVTQLPSPPANDDCENAEYAGIIEAGNSISMTFDDIENATVDCLPGCYMPEIWISFTVEEALDVTIDYCSTTNSGFMCGSLLMYTSCPCDLNSNSVYMDYDNHYCDFLSAMLCFYKNELSPGTYYFPILTYPLTPEGSVFEIRITGLERQQCSDNTLFGQKPPTQGSEINGSRSEINSGVICTDNFAGVDEPINSISWWALSSVNHEYYGFCEQDTIPFKITFCEDIVGLPGDTVAIYDVNVCPELTGHQFLGSPEIKLSTLLDPPLSLEEGWLIICSDEPDTSCWFYWMNSSVPGESYTYQISNDQWGESEYNLAFCLGPAPTSIDDESYELPSKFGMAQNYPNPFNATTSIQFSLKNIDNVELDIYDVRGSLTKSLFSGELSAGTHSIVWDGTNQSGDKVSSGIYFYRLQTSEKTSNNSMILLK